MFKVINGTKIALSEEEISSYNAEEAALQSDLIRNQRNTLLSQSDVFALADKITDEWKTYRQALRDVPAQAGFPDNITWPTKPV